MDKITVIGAGNMGGALVKGWSRAAINAEITVAVLHVEKANALKVVCPDITIVTDTVAAVTDADIVVLAIKPWQAEAVLRSISSSLKPDAILISVVAGIRNAQLKEMLSDSRTHQICTVIPNLAAEFSESMSFIAPAEGVSDETVEKVKNLFDSVGSTMLCDEKQLNAGMLLSSCGIAYIMKILRAQQEAGVEMGFKPSDALSIALQTMAGATTMLRGTGEHPCEAADRVATPGGYTIKGLNEMDHSGLMSALIKVFKTGY